MGVNILYGESRPDLIKECLDQVHQYNKNFPNNRAIIIVPETSKMDMEYEFLTAYEDQGMMLTEVLSFSRFCYRVLGELGLVSDNLIDDAGKSMLIYKILKENEDKFIIFKNLCQKPGFISEILSVMGDLKRVLIDAPKLASVSQGISDPILAQKARELSILFESYQLALQENSLEDPQENYTKTTEQIRLLVDKKGTGPVKWPFDQLEWLFYTKIWIAGFGETRDFTPQEYDLIRNLSQCCDIVMTCVCETPSDYKNTTSHSQALFRAGNQCASGIEKNGLLSLPLPFKKIISSDNSIFSCLVMKWKNQSASPIAMTEGPSAFNLVYTNTKREEIAIIAGEIKRLVADDNFRYRDITVMATGIDSYNPIVHAIFQDAGIPYFLDDKKSLKSTSLVRMVRSLLDLLVYPWSQSNLMNYVRCGFCNATIQEIDEFDTFLLSRGIKWRKQFFDDKRFDPAWNLAMNSMNTKSENDNNLDDDINIRDNTDNEVIKNNTYSIGNNDNKNAKDSNENIKTIGKSPMLELRDRIYENILVFEKQCGKSKTSLDFCHALRIFLHSERISEKIKKWSDDLLSDKQENAATGLVKAWNELLHLLGQMEQIAKDTPIDVESFRGILMSGMEKAYSGTIPSSADQVHFVPIKQIGIRQTPVLFIIGLTQDSYPEKISSEGILKDRDREAFSEYFQIKIPSKISDKYYEDLFMTYSLFCFPTHKMYMSCPETKERESSVMTFARNCFPGCNTIEWTENPNPSDVQIYSKTSAFQTLLTMLPTTGSMGISHNKNINRNENEIIDDSTRQWLALYNWMMQNPYYSQRLFSIKNKLDVSDQPIRLPEEKVAQRYSDPITMSVSQLETYFACAYSHFVKYLLKLKPRLTWSLESSDTGSLLHGIAELAVKQFLQEFSMADDENEKNIIIEKYKNMNFEELSLEKMNEIIKRDQMGTFLDQGFFSSKGRSSYKLAATTLEAIFKQFDMQEFIPGILEWEFSSKNNNALNLRLPGFPSLLFQGKVDRIDFQESYFRVIDYKSGNKVIEFDNWYHGLSLQLPAYIAAFRQQYPDRIPIDAAYMQFVRPMISYENGSIKEIKQKQETKIRNQFNLRGTKMNPDELLTASQFTIKKMEEISLNLLHGKIDVKPKKLVGKEPPCSYCDYLPICGFESRYDSFDLLKPMEKINDSTGKALSKSEVFCRMMAKEEQKGKE